MPRHRGGVGERGDLVHHHPQPRRVTAGGRVGRPERAVERARGADPHRRGQLGDQLPLLGLGRGRTGPAHHVVGGDALQQRAFQPLLPRHDQVSGVPGQRLATGRRHGRLLGRPAEPADQLTGQVLQRGQRLRPAVEPGGPAGQREQLAAHRGELRRGHRAGGAVLRGGELTDRGPLGRVGQRGQRDEARVQAVLEVVHRVGHIVGPVHDLGFQAGPARRGAVPDPAEDLRVVGVRAVLDQAGPGHPGLFADEGGRAGGVSPPSRRLAGGSGGSPPGLAPPTRGGAPEACPLRAGDSRGAPGGRPPGLAPPTRGGAPEACPLRGGDSRGRGVPGGVPRASRAGGRPPGAALFRYGYLSVASRVARVRFSPAPGTLASSRVSSRRLCAFPSKPPHGAASSARAASPLWPNGGCPRSCARHAASTRSASQPSTAPSSRPICAHSSEWVSRVRGKSPASTATTCVLAASRRSAEVCSTRARSRSNGLRGNRARAASAAAEGSQAGAAARLGGSAAQRAVAW